MKVLQVIALFVLAVAIAYAGFRYTGGFGATDSEKPRYIINDIYSLVIIPGENSACEAAVGYREKHVIGTFVATPAKELVCDRYYFEDKPDDAEVGLHARNRHKHYAALFGSIPEHGVGRWGIAEDRHLRLFEGGAKGGLLVLQREADAVHRADGLLELFRADQFVLMHKP